MNEILENENFTEEDENYFRENGCSESFIQLLKNRVNISSEKHLKDFINELERYEKNNSLFPFEEEIITLIKKEFYILDFVGSEDLDKNIRRSEYQYNGDTFTANGYEFSEEDKRY